MKIGKYLKFHFECLENGRIPNSGLCYCDMGDLFKLMHPTENDIGELMREQSPFTWWGRGDYKYKTYDYSPLRQTIVLLMAAMAGEL